MTLKGKMMLLALDLGTKMGWATSGGVEQGKIKSGMQSFATDRFSGGGMRYLKFEKWLNDMPRPTQVVYEEVRRHAGTTAAHVYGGLMAVLTKWCEANQIPYTSVPVGTIKKFWTGSGNASKGKMIAEGNKRGFDTKDDNEMDAIALIHYWLEQGMFE